MERKSLGIKSVENRYSILRRKSFTKALKNFKEGKEFIQFLIEARKNELLQIQDEAKMAGIDEVKIFVPVIECESCLKLEDKIFKLTDALESMPLPNPNCTNKKEESGSSHGWCMCSYNPVIDIQKSNKFLNEKYPLPSNIEFGIKYFGRTIKSKSPK